MKDYKYRARVNLAAALLWIRFRIDGKTHP
jgi:hypothetical protein